MRAGAEGPCLSRQMDTSESQSLGFGACVHTHTGRERQTRTETQREPQTEIGKERTKDRKERERERDRETPTLQHKITVPSSGGLILTSRPTESPITDWGPMWPGGLARPLSPAEEETETATAVELVLTSADSIQNAYLPWQLTLVGPMKPALY